MLQFLRAYFIALMDGGGAPLRGGHRTSASPTDCLLATRFGVAAVALLADGRLGHIVPFKRHDIGAIPIRDAPAATAPPSAGLGICFED